MGCGMYKCKASFIKGYSNLCVMHYIMQCGGGENTCKGKRIVHAFMSKRLITSLEELDVTNHKCLSVIPTQQQVRDAIADIIQHKEKAPNEYAYIEFPFGLLDYTGLKDIDKYYMDIQLKSRISEEKRWLAEIESQRIQELGISLEKVADFFVTHVWGKLSNKGNAVRNLVGKRWMTDNEYAECKATQ